MHGTDQQIKKNIEGMKKGNSFIKFEARIKNKKGSNAMNKENFRRE